MNHRFLAAAAAFLAAGSVLASAQETGLEYRYFDSAGVRVAFMEKGQGEPVILLHAAMADLEFNWVKFGILNTLAGNHWTIALDLRGHGKSGKPHDPKAYGRLMAQDVLKLMDHLRIPKAHLLGYSMGSHIALTIVADYPDRVISAIFGGPTWIHPGQDMEPPPSEEFLAKMNDSVFGGRNDVQAVLLSIGSQADWAVTEEALQAAHVPCLFIFGKKDENRKQIPDLQRAMAKYAEFVEIEGAGHGDTVLSPEFLKAVLPFLAGHTASTKSPI